MQKGVPEKPLKNVAQFHFSDETDHGEPLPDDRSKWLLEPKLDGYRAIAVKSGSHANLYSMEQQDLQPGALKPNQKIRNFRFDLGRCFAGRGEHERFRDRDQTGVTAEPDGDGVTGLLG